jgi:hypothetical protein
MPYPGPLYASLTIYSRPRRAKGYAFTLQAYSRASCTKPAVVLLPPINFIFKLLQQRANVSIWLYENLGMRIEGKLRVRSHQQGSWL